MNSNKERAEELLKVFWESDHHNVALALKEVLEKLREQLSGKDGLNFNDEMNVMYHFGWGDCLKEIDCIIDELELL